MSIGDELKRRMRKAGNDAIRKAAEELRDAAAANVGVGDPSEDPNPALALASTGQVIPDGDGFIVMFSTPYAAKQHEDKRLQHPRGGKAKYLEDEVKAMVPKIEGIVASEVAKMTTGQRTRR